MVSPRMGLLVLGTFVALPIAAQGRTVDLTGRPAASLDEPFTAIGTIQEVGPGVVVISDMAEERLVRANLANGEIRDIGRKGSGPGEWQMPMGVLPGVGGNVMIPDLMQAKVHEVSPAGSIERSIPLTGGDDGMMTMIMPQGIDAAGRMFYTGAPFGPDRQPTDSMPILRRSLLAANPTTDTVAWLPNPIQMTGSASASGGGMRITMGRPGPYAPTDEWEVLPDGRVAVVRAEPYRVEIHAPGRAPVVGPTVPYTPVRVGKAERKAYNDRMANATGMMVTMGTNGGGRNAQRMSMGDQPATPDEDFPETMPPFERGNSIVVSPNGETWVLRTRAADDPVPVYDIFSTAGQRVGTAKLRANSTVAGFGNGTIYIQRQDPADDLRYLERYSI